MWLDKFIWSFFAKRFWIDLHKDEYSTFTNTHYETEIRNIGRHHLDVLKKISQMSFWIQRLSSCSAVIYFFWLCCLKSIPKWCIFSTVRLIYWVSVRVTRELSCMFSHSGPSALMSSTLSLRVIKTINISISIIYSICCLD